MTPRWRLHLFNIYFDAIFPPLDTNFPDFF